jgi:nitrite reductase/ring-hydroxylating ferredoxin subunit
MMIYSWHKVADLTVSLLTENKLMEVSLGEKRIGILKRNERIFAFAARCPHASAPLCDGWLDAQGRIVCPLHHYRYDPANGRNTSGEGYKLVTYPVEIKNDEIFIGLLS